MFNPFRTDRLWVRPIGPEDIDGFVGRRNDPLVAKYGNWALPYPRRRAQQLVDSVSQMEGPTNHEWYMLVVEKGDGEVVGDLALFPTFEGRSMEVGYTLASDQWGRGYASEAVGGLVSHLYSDPKLSRVSAMLHPDNTASAMVLERNGFLFEGHTRLSYWVGEENTDDWIYGLTRADWESWSNRPRHVPAQVTLVPIDQSNEAEVYKLKTHKTQERFVAPMAYSYADALFPEMVNGAPVTPWLRAVHADDVLVGFVMLALRSEHHPEPYLWRLLVDRMHQRRGIGRMVLDQVVEVCRSMGDSSLTTSWSPGRGTPEPFYLSYGFERTGNIIDDEIEGRLRFPES